MTTVMLATETEDLGLVPAATAAARAKRHATETGKPVSIRHPVSDKLLRTVKPKAATKAKGTVKGKPKAKTKAKAATTAKPKADRKPRGRVAEFVKLASRKHGVSPAELNEVTRWKGAPWRWLFSNPKRNGYCDRWNYSFKVAQIDGETQGPPRAGLFWPVLAGDRAVQR